MFKTSTLLTIFLCSSFHLQSFAQFIEGIPMSIQIDTNLIINEVDQAQKVMRTDPIKAQEMMNNTLQLSINANYGNGIRNSVYSLMVLSQQQKYPKALIYFSDLLISYCKPIIHDSLICDALLLKGIAYNRLENFDLSIKCYHKSLLYARDPEKIAQAYANISTVMYNIGEVKKATKYLDKALESSTGPISPKWLSNKARAYMEIGDWTNALIFIDSAYQTAESLEAKANILFHKILLLTEQGSYQEAIKQFKAFHPDLLNADISMERRALIFLSVAYTYFKIKDYKSTQKYLFAANEYRHHLSKNDRRRLLHQLSEFYYVTEDYKKAFDLHKLSHQLIDSAKSKEILFKVNELETQYRTSQKDKAIAEQQVIITKNASMRFKDRVLAASIVAGLIILLLLLWNRYYYLKQRNQKLRSGQEINRLQALMEGEEKERTRLSHELHDGVNSSLAATTSYLQTMEQLYPEMSGTEPFIKVKQLLESTSSEVRAVAHNLAPHILMKNGLKYAIEDFCANLFPKDVAVEVQSFGDEQFLPEDTALFMYRIAQELLHNVHKHAEASEVIIALGVLENEVSLTIEDNGIGIQNNGEKKSGIGLDNMKERIRSYNGELTIESVPGKGTVVYVCVRFEM